MWPFVVAHYTSFILGGYWVFSAAVSSMPDVDTSSGKGYIWLYKFLHAVAGDVASLYAAKLPPKVN